jgi:pyruvate/2-oxoglutarate dehydrogenase complex dihydrolipoamide dehydrogenase (E3) component
VSPHALMVRTASVRRRRLRQQGRTPTKTMVASARLAYQARRGVEYGVRIGSASVDLAGVREQTGQVAGARQNCASRLPQDGLDLIEGEARPGRRQSRSR